MKLPLVALCGRPNVGKSTLFNRLTRSRAALVHDLPGMTRDRSYGRVTCLGEEGDPEEVFELVDTGGLDFEGDDVITQGITRMAEAALGESHMAILLVDQVQDLPGLLLGYEKLHHHGQITLEFDELVFVQHPMPAKPGHGEEGRPAVHSVPLRLGQKPVVQEHAPVLGVLMHVEPEGAALRHHGPPR